MHVIIKNCNNIDDGEFQIIKNTLNIKYAINGTGKSTIAKAIKAFVENDEEIKKKLIPFKNKIIEPEHQSELIGLEEVKSILIFDEQYVASYMYKTTELVENSFEIFIKTKDYEERITEISKLLKDVNDMFSNYPELNLLIDTFNAFVEGFGKTKNGYSVSSSIGKSIGKGNLIDNIPETLNCYEPYLTDINNVKWLKWQQDGKKYLELAEQCPYCTNNIEHKKEAILEISQVYNPKEVEELNKTLEILGILKPYFADITKENVEEISKNINGITDIQKEYLKEIKKQAENFKLSLIRIKNLNFYSLKDIEKIHDEIKTYLLDISYFSHFDNELTKEKVVNINKILEEILNKAGLLQGEIAKQKNTIKQTIEMYEEEINLFLVNAGYKYKVKIIEDPNNKTEYKLVLKHINLDEPVEKIEQHLSYGEKNALALVLFMYSAIKSNPELIILDDPMSSYDGNKNFAILNRLFMGKMCLKNRTVLLLTHEFSTVIDAIYNLPHLFEPGPKATFLVNKKGKISEKIIRKEDILSFSDIAKKNIKSNIDNLNKLIYLRRLYEITSKGSLEWNLLSSIFHKRERPTIQKSRGKCDEMKDSEINSATEKIIKCIGDFNYEKEYEKTKNISVMKKIYKDSKSNYEKLQIYRIIFDRENKKNKNQVINKYINEVFHIENDYIFQVNPIEYDTVPQYIIDECDKDIDNLN